MSPFTHYKAAFLTALFAYWTAFKIKFGIKRKNQLHHVLNSGMEGAVARYARICQTILDHLPPSTAVQGGVVCEIGCGDCFAAADMMLALGASHVHLVESLPLSITPNHRIALSSLAAAHSLPNQGQIFTPLSPPTLNPTKATYHQGFLEHTRLPQTIDLLYSFDVLEHVEDLNGFFAYCAQAIKPGGWMIHKFDLSGHGLFEDPMPPLDFQTFPTWLFHLMFLKYQRAAGHFADEFVTAMEQHGFENITLSPIRVADPAYLKRIWPHLRRKARQRPPEIVELLDLVITAQRKSPVSVSVS